MTTIAQTLQQMGANNIEQVRLVWCDLHGDLRGKTLMPRAVAHALENGIGLVGTLALKDTSDRTAFKIFEPEGAYSAAALPEFANASNMLLRPFLESYQTLPWSPGTAWLQGQLHHADGRMVAFDTRSILRTALAKLAKAGLAMQCGLEVEFHIYKIDSSHPQLNPELASWPGLPPTVSMVHPGYRLLSEQWADMADEPLEIVRNTAKALHLPLSSLEIEMGPSQVEAVFDVTDALTAADNMVLFRSAVTQALRRAGYHASFMCRPPFPHIMSSGWHLHQSLTDVRTDMNLLAREEGGRAAHPTKDSKKVRLAGSTHQSDGAKVLSPLGQHYLSGLLAHAAGCTALSNPTINAYARFQPGALAPQQICWGIDNRAAMLRVIAAGQSTRIENRVGEPMANPYLYMASQIHAGLDGIKRELPAPPAATRAYISLEAVEPADSGKAGPSSGLPASLANALDALQSNKMLVKALGKLFIDYFCRVKSQEISRFEAAKDPTDWQRREYFSRY